MTNDRAPEPQPDDTTARLVTIVGRLLCLNGVPFAEVRPHKANYRSPKACRHYWPDPDSPSGWCSHCDLMEADHEGEDRPAVIPTFDAGVSALEAALAAAGEADGTRPAPTHVTCPACFHQWTPDWLGSTR